MTLQDFFTLYPKAAIAFSGGVDSAYLLYAARRYAADVRAYYVKSEFQPEFEWEDAVRLASQLEVKMSTLPLKVLAVPGVSENPSDRCYYCKRAVFGVIAQTASADGYKVLLDGTNASDDAGDRPGMRALKEMSVLSPLRECGMTKDQIRQFSRQAGLFTWNKPAYACLATRIPAGEEITIEKLQVTEMAEAYLQALKFSDLRVRSQDGHARLQVPEEQMEKVLLHRKEILNKLKSYYKTVSLDLDAR